MFIAAIRYILANKYMIAIGFVLVSYATFFAYYLYSDMRIENLSDKNSTLQRELAIKEDYISTLKIDYGKIIKAKDELSVVVERSNKKVNELNAKLNRESANKKNIQTLAAAKPTLIEKYINRETKRQIDCLRTISADGDC